MKKFNTLEKGNGDIKYDIAVRKVQQMKSFYNHLLAYFIFNTIIIFANHGNETGAEFWEFSTFSLAFFWGIGLVAHGVSVFGRSIIFSTEWEQRKIRELMEKNKKENWE